MINTTHLRVLLAKDFLTLRRNQGYILAFLLLPLGLMSAFIGIQRLVDKGAREGSLMQEDFFYTSTLFFNMNASVVNAPFMDVLPYNKDVGEFGTLYASSLQACTRQNRNKYHYSKAMIISDNGDVRLDFKRYMEDYMFKVAGFPSNWTVDTFVSQEEAFKEYKSESQTPYCFGITFNKFDLKNDVYDVEFHWSKEQLPDTNLPAYNEQIKAPDL